MDLKDLSDDECGGEDEIKGQVPPPEGASFFHTGYNPGSPDDTFVKLVRILSLLAGMGDSGGRQRDDKFGEDVLIAMLAEGGSMGQGAHKATAIKNKEQHCSLEELYEGTTEKMKMLEIKPKSYCSLEELYKGATEKMKMLKIKSRS
ncbi:hypothetical protein IFM89_031732 [Coptis chinensis]|uniref:Uncharacterized protein n=1 Tax=Coptis chinensis TaxID=261450 RepID=A0A835H3Q8_9MAGN|nr:hypothetical protein IFM89_031732 [Coptis chinensis]